MTCVGLDESLAAAAGELACKHSLKGADAVHLATAMLARSPDRPVLMSTWDKQLADAAFASGFSIVRE